MQKIAISRCDKNLATLYAVGKTKIMRLVIQKYLRNLNQPIELRSVNTLVHKSAETWTQKITISYGNTATFTFPLRQYFPISVHKKFGLPYFTHKVTFFYQKFNFTFFPCVSRGSYKIGTQALKFLWPEILKCLHVLFFFTIYIFKNYITLEVITWFEHF